MTFEVRKLGAVIPVSRHVLLDHGLVEPTDAERREFEASHAEYARRRQAASEALPAFLAALRAVDDPVARAVIDLHGRTSVGECTGCEFSGYEAEPPGWPCSTIGVVAQAVGIPVPPDLDMLT